MGLRDRVKERVRKLVGKVSGEYSAVAPEEITPYERPGVPDENARVIRARIPRPVDS